MIQFTKISDNLPTPRLVFQELVHLITDPFSSIYDIVSLVSEDPALSFHALMLADLSHFENSQKLISVKQALPVLGIERVTKLVLSAHVISEEQEYQEKLYRHSLSCGCASRIIGRSLYPNKPLKLDILFTLGLMHDLGKLVIFSYLHLPKENQESTEKNPIFDNSSSLKEVDYSQIGAEFVSNFDLPAEFYQVIRFHHQPMKAFSNKESVMIVHLADYLSCLLETDQKTSCSFSLDDDCWEVLGLEKDKTPYYLSLLKDEFQKSEVFLRLSEVDNKSH
jgi:HD-like signal output (HDOD) protein